jgi:hypothetical protein
MISYTVYDSFHILPFLKFIEVLISVSITQSAIAVLLHEAHRMCPDMKFCLVHNWRT